MIWVDADACPVKDEVIRVAERHDMPVTFVANGGLRPTVHPLVSITLVPEGPDVADKWIADRVGRGDVCVTGDIPLAARVIAAGGRALGHDGTAFTAANIGSRLAMRDLMADLRAAGPFRQGGGKPFGRADRARFLEGLERELRAAARG